MKNASISVKYEGTLQGLVDYVQRTFKDLNNVIVSVDFTHSETEAADKLPACSSVLKSNVGLGTWHEVYTLLALRVPTATKEALERATNVVIDELALDRKIGAIKGVRNHLFIGLKEAKDAVDLVIDRLPHLYKSAVAAHRADAYLL